MATELMTVKEAKSSRTPPLFLFAGGEKVPDSALLELGSFPLDAERAGGLLQCKLRLTKRCFDCARRVRRVSSCLGCLRLCFCEDVPQSLVDWAEERGLVDHSFKGTPCRAAEPVVVDEGEGEGDDDGES